MPTLSIGDGANDLRMIEVADIGMMVNYNENKDSDE